MDDREKDLRAIDDRCNRSIDHRVDREGSYSKKSYMPHNIEMTEGEYQTHLSTMGKKQLEKAQMGLPLYRGSKIKVLKKYY